MLAVLRRAESLFAAPSPASPGPGVDAAAALEAAADTTEAITAGPDGMAGAAAGAHEAFLAGAAQRLRATADADTRLAERLEELTDAHRAAALAAQQLRENAESVVHRYISAPDSNTDADLTALRVLRAQVAAMQRLVADQSAASAAAAQQVRALEFGQG